MEWAKKSANKLCVHKCIKIKRFRCICFSIVKLIPMKYSRFEMEKRWMALNSQYFFVFHFFPYFVLLLFQHFIFINPEFSIPFDSHAINLHYIQQAHSKIDYRFFWKLSVCVRGSKRILVIRCTLSSSSSWTLNIEYHEYNSNNFHYNDEMCHNFPV